MDASIAELKGKLSLYSQGEVEQAKIGSRRRRTRAKNDKFSGESMVMLVPMIAVVKFLI